MAKAIKLKKTEDTPLIDFQPEKGSLIVQGRSLPANTFEFYMPIMKEIENYLRSPKELTEFDFKLDFISSSSSKVFQDLFYQLESMYNKGNDVRVNWYYRIGEEDIKELGDDFKQNSNIPFEFIAYE